MLTHRQPCLWVIHLMVDAANLSSGTWELTVRDPSRSVMRNDRRVIKWWMRCRDGLVPQLATLLVYFGADLLEDRGADELARTAAP
jgi:predicted metal-dependent hydrolase